MYCKAGLDGKCKSKSSPAVSITGKYSPDQKFINRSKFLLISVCYVYTMLCMLGLILGMLTECNLKSFNLTRFHSISDMEMINFHLSHVKLLSTVLLCFLITRDLIIYKYFGTFIGLIDRLLNSQLKFYKKGVSRTKKILSFMSSCILWIFVINSMLIIVVNPSLLNPGPLKELKVTSFNCQGLIPFSELNEDHPTLNVTKMHEINQYLISHEPDIFMLNETWLKSL